MERISCFLQEKYEEANQNPGRVQVTIMDLLRLTAELLFGGGGGGGGQLNRWGEK